MKCLPCQILLPVLFMLFSLPARAQAGDDGFDPKLNIDFDLRWDTLMATGATPKNWGKGFLPAVDIRNDYRLPPPLGQGTDPYCGVYASIHTELSERAIADIETDQLHPTPLLAAIANKKRNPQLLGDVIQTALEMDMIHSNTWSPVFIKTDERENKIIRLFRAISHHHPVLVRLSKSPEKPRNKQNNPEEYTPKRHAMVVVGYDDHSVIAMNSRGKFWGDSGYCNIPKDTFFQIVIDGIMFSTQGRSFDPGELGVPVVLEGETELRRHSQGNWQTVEMALDSLTHTCLPVQTQDWNLSKEVFQLSINLPKLACIYLLDFKPDTVELLEKWIYEPPGRRLTQAFRLEDSSEQLVVLHTTLPLVDMQEAAAGLSAAKGNAMERLSAVFGEALVPASDIQRGENPAKFTANATSGGQWFIVPVVLGFGAPSR